MNGERRHLSPQEKVAALKRHLLENVPVSTLCDELGIAPTLFYRWQKELFENCHVVFENGRYLTKGQVGLGKEAFFMLNFGRLLGALGAPTMEMGGQTMVGQHGGFSMHGPMLMAGKVDPRRLQCLRSGQVRSARSRRAHIQRLGAVQLGLWRRPRARP